LGNKLKEFIALAESLGLSALIEIHTSEELEIALAADADIIGINNRNLDNFITDINTSCRLRSMIPEEKIVVAESGIHTRKDIESLLQSGIRAFLIGDALISAADMGKKLKEFMEEGKT